MPLSTAEIRTAFLDFFAEKHGHKILPSASLIPTNPTVMLTPAGMLPFVPIFMGVEPAPTPPRATSSQKCARVSGKASDLSYVGRTPRHHTFFEMLGNFSFGDYFKQDAIPWAWAFITEVLKLPKEKLWVSVFYDDKESRAIWENVVGLPPERVWDKDEKDNFWGPPGPTGPCGPCTEIYYDLGPQFEDEEDRYIEIWNVVCMELFKDANGQTAPLKAKNIDTGMGLERIAMVVQGVDNTFETDLLFKIVSKVAELTGTRYKQDAEIDVALKIVADHMRCVAFAIADGVTPSNDGRGYIIRMILRRAVRYAKKLGLNEAGLFKLVSTIRDCYQDPYAELKDKYSLIVDTVKAEERRFLETLDRGNKLLDEALEKLSARKQAELAGDDAFKLYDTFGFPLELTIEICEERGFSVDEVGFESALQAQKTRARAAQGDKTIVSDQLYADILQEYGATRFTGYEATEGQGTVVAIITNGQRVDAFGGESQTNAPFEVILDATPFYAESGGQVGDQGIFYVADGPEAETIVIQDTQKVGDLIVHKALYDQGDGIRVGQTVQAEVAADPRRRTQAHHSATHLLHAALKKILGEHVAQAGSLVGPKGARFDFNFQRGVTSKERAQLEVLVNRWIRENNPRTVREMPVDDAKAAGAIAMFGEKYGDTVRVVDFGEASIELCGGTHVDATGDIGFFKILSEGSVASGVRRIEFVVGDAALLAVHRQEQLLAEVSEQLKTPPAELTQAIEKLQAELKTRDQQLKQLAEKEAVKQIQVLLAEAPSDKVVVTRVDAADVDNLKWMTEQLAQRLGAGHAVLLASDLAGKAMFCASVSEELQAKGLKASEFVKTAATICDGGGGGKPNFAQAGGKNPQKIPDALEAVRVLVEAAPVTK